jgi:hypothetical protein
MDVTSSSKTLVTTYQTTRCHKPEYHNPKQIPCYQKPGFISMFKKPYSDSILSYIYPGHILIACFFTYILILSFYLCFNQELVIYLDVTNLFYRDDISTLLLQDVATQVQLL